MGNPLRMDGPDCQAIPGIKMSELDSLSPALFLDRDGVVNREVGYLSKPEQVEFMPGIFDLCRRAQALGYKLILVTNQSGIARQLYTEQDFHLLMRWIDEQFTKAGVRLSGYYFCPHHPEHGIGPYRKECPDRKPGPGMLLRAAREHHINLRQSILIGDRCSDIEAGAAAGVKSLILLAGTESEACQRAPVHAVVAALSEAAETLRQPHPSF